MENKLKEFVVPRLPLWLGTQQLTNMTILWRIVIIGLSSLAQFNVHILAAQHDCNYHVLL